MKAEIRTKRNIEEIEIPGGSDSKAYVEIGKDDKQKIDTWLKEILGKGEGIDTMHFPVMKYIFDATGYIGNSLIVKECVTNKTLDLTDIDKW